MHLGAYAKRFCGDLCAGLSFFIGALVSERPLLHAPGLATHTTSDIFAARDSAFFRRHGQSF